MSTTNIHQKVSMPEVYCCGFMFSKETREVALIEKKKPDWMARKLNGIGGKVQNNETPAAAMVREFREETGLDTLESMWIPSSLLWCQGGAIFFFSATIPSVLFQDIDSIEEEQVVFKSLDPGHPCFYQDYPRMNNLDMLIAIARDTTIRKPTLLIDNSYESESSFKLISAAKDCFTKTRREILVDLRLGSK